MLWSRRVPGSRSTSPERTPSDRAEAAPRSTRPCRTPVSRLSPRAAFLAIVTYTVPAGGTIALADEIGVDTVRVGLEVGIGSDVTNEQFYEDAFIDTLPLGRRLVSDPEARVSSVLRTALEGTRDGRAIGYRLQGE